MFKVKYFIAYDVMLEEGVVQSSWDIITLPIFGSIEVMVVTYIQDIANVVGVERDWVNVTKLNKLN
jgi:hypothetical protein